MLLCERLTKGLHIRVYQEPHPVLFCLQHAGPGVFSGAMNQFSDVAERRLIISIRAVQKRQFVAADPIATLGKVIQQRQGLVRTKRSDRFAARDMWRAKQLKA